jgi:hypothetical protein
MWAKIRGILFWVLAMWIVFGLLIEGFTRSHVHEGGECGSQHHWVYVRANFTGLDLSCEPDR